ncbi:MAG: glycosyltransferase family 39 protein [Betaproteobacteria bacterium]|nr:glycosyltransferase family 39 protein [Betaproteobacteria bacterium]MBK7654052.1 glycosyltransferase family 39 protein [Betaproteobacteria bacterium]
MLLGLVLLVRLVTLGAYPFFATTEPRYAEIARKMLETGNWVTPWFDHDVPFWGKPPLSFWGSAATMKLFGVSEFAARLAPFLATILIAALFWAWPRVDRFERALPTAAALVMVSSLVGFVASGAVMTDMFMVLGTAMSMVSFWVAVNDSAGKTPWRWLFFAGLAIGLLSKGPVATVITGIALGGWVLGQPMQRIKTLLHALPWVRGLLLTVVLTLPWYLLAEQRTPGFLAYFILGEHLQRFLVSGWTGDLYGAGHAEPRGLIWWFGFGGFLPWTPLAIVAWLMRWFGQSECNAPAKEGWLPGEWQYLLAWTLAPIAFFTLARNILEAYVLPGLPAFSLLAAILMLLAFQRRTIANAAWSLAVLMPLWASVMLIGFPEVAEQRSQKSLLKVWQPQSDLYYLGVRPLSANFYTAGRARLVQDPAEFDKVMGMTGDVTLVLEQPWLAALTPRQLDGWKVVHQHAGFTMLHR